MYKRFDINALKTIQNNFVQNIYNYIRREQCVTSSDFFKKIFKEGTDVYYCNRSEVIMSCSKTENDTFIIRDEREKIEVLLDEQGKKDFHNIIKQYILKKEKQTGQKTIEQILMDEFSTGIYNTINDKPYLVYDIETTMADDPKNAKYLIGYAMYPTLENKMEYEYISQEKLPEFVQRMIDFDGYIIGYNNIWFDNVVCVANTGFDQEKLNIINEKSIDLFVFLQNLTGKRLGLNKVATALTGVQKTLESGTQAEVLWKRYKEQGDEKAGEECKLYCKNDVRMTALVLLYLLYYQKVFIEGEEKTFDIEQFMETSNSTRKEEKKEITQNQSLF